MEEGRLFEIRAQGLLEGAVEDGISGCVCEVGDYESVILRELDGSMRTIVEACRDEKSETNNGGRDQDSYHAARSWGA